jgi:hypothetical protein
MFQKVLKKWHRILASADSRPGGYSRTMASNSLLLRRKRRLQQLDLNVCTTTAPPSHLVLTLKHRKTHEGVGSTVKRKKEGVPLLFTRPLLLRPTLFPGRR